MVFSTVLHYAVRWGHIDLTKFLIEEQKVDINSKNIDGK